VADDLLTTTALATTAPLVVAPAMNVHMWENGRTSESIAILRDEGVRVIEPATGHLACGYDGKGKLADVETIVSETIAVLGDAIGDDALDGSARRDGRRRDVGYLDDDRRDGAGE
jgi:phosphopantothenoylcysteine decarboxylase/phosphopantothenate--cysteine ligase